MESALAGYTSDCWSARIFKPPGFKDIQRTNSHNNQEPCAEPSEVDHCIAGILHKVIWVRTSSTYPVGQWCDNIGCDDE